MKLKKMNLLFILVPLLLIALFKLYPVLIAIVESFFTGRIGEDRIFSGFSNYANMFSDPVFWKSLNSTLIFNIFINPIQIIAAIILALMLNTKFKGVRLIRTIMYFPVTISVTTSAVIWDLLLDPNRGLVNAILKAMGLPAQPFFTSDSQAMLSIIILASWKGIAYWMMFLMAGLQGVPANVYEAALIDGSNTFITTFKIVIPMIKRSILFVVVSDTISNLLMFSPMYLITKGGPNKSTNVLMYEAYKSTFAYADYGRAYAYVVVLLILIFIIVGVQLKAMRSED